MFVCVCVFCICDITYLSASVQKSYKATILRGDLFVASLDLQFFPSNQHACREVLRLPRWGWIFRPRVWAPPPHRLSLCPCLPLSVSPSLLYTGLFTQAPGRVSAHTEAHPLPFAEHSPAHETLSRRQGCLESTRGNWDRDPTWGSSWILRRP